MITVSEAANFIKLNCLKDWTLDEIKLEIIKAINNNTLIYSTDEKENLIGICIAEDFKNEKRLHVKAIVANKQLNRFIEYFNNRFPNYIISCYRRGVFKTLKL